MNKKWVKINKRISECWKMCNCGWLSVYVCVHVCVCDNKASLKTTENCQSHAYETMKSWHSNKARPSGNTISHAHTYTEAMTFPWLTFDSSALQLCCSFVRSIPFSYSCATCCMSLAYLSAILILPQFQSKYIFSTPISQCCCCCVTLK